MKKRAKYLVKKENFPSEGTFYYVYKRNWLGKFKLIIHNNNDGLLKDLYSAIKWIDEMEQVEILFRDNSKNT